MKRNRISTIKLENCQIKSAEKFKAVCQALDVLEKETFIRSGCIGFSNVFICPDVDLLPFYHSKDPMEHLMAELCMELHVKEHGRRSDPRYLEIVKGKK